MSSFDKDSNAAALVWDCIVVGLGGHGSAAVAHIARMGSEGSGNTGGNNRSNSYKVLGLEKFRRVHANGSSHGRSRIIRQAYFEDPRYVPLLKRSFELWRDLAKFEAEESVKRTGEVPEESLLCMTGGIMIGQPGSTVIEGTLASVRTHGLPHEILNAKEITERYSVFKPPSPATIGILESEAGYLVPEACVEAHFKVAEQYGAELHFEESLVTWEPVSTSSISGGSNSHSNNSNDSNSNSSNNNDNSPLIRVTTDKGREYFTRKIVLSVGAWAPDIYGKTIPIPLHVERRVLFWFKPPDKFDLKEFAKIPIYIWDLGSKGNFYGFPLQGGEPKDAVKVAMHYVDVKANNKCTPDTIDREVHPNEIKAMRELLRDHIPGLEGEIAHTATCMYTVTPDEHFLIDFHPAYKNVVLASPCSGHGFKFCSVVGEIIGTMIHTGSTSSQSMADPTCDISLFSFDQRLRRFTPSSVSRL